MVNIFSTRNKDCIFYMRRTGWGTDVPPKEIVKFFGQIVGDLEKYFSGYDCIFLNSLYKKAYKDLCRETGKKCFMTYAKINYDIPHQELCYNILYTEYDLWFDCHGDFDYFIKIKLDLIELIYANAVEMVKNSKIIDSDIKNLINQRLNENNICFLCFNGLFTRVYDEKIFSIIEEPFWDTIKDPIWNNVAQEIKCANLLMSSNMPGSVLESLKALESSIKIISDKKGWSTGNEKGASNYIDNLVSQKNGRFIDVWEKDILVYYFRLLRNEYAHGSGNNIKLSLSKEQERCVYEQVMSWIKRLVIQSGI